MLLLIQNYFSIIGYTTYQGVVHMGFVDVLPKTFFIDTTKVRTYEEFFALGPHCTYWWQHKEEDEPWPTVKLEQRTAVKLWDGRVKVLYKGDYLVWCNSNPVQIGMISYIAYELGNHTTIMVQNIAQTLSAELWNAWIMSKVVNV